jgi:hypothetical protein
MEGSNVKNVWETPEKNGEERYKKFLLNNSKVKNIEINPNWFNILDFKIHNSHLSGQEYKIKENEWRKFLKKWTFDKFIEERMDGKKLEFKNIYK